MAKLLIPTALRAFTDGKAQLDIDTGKTTAGALLAEAAVRYPDVKPHLYDDEGKLRAYVNVFVGDENIRNFGGLDAPVEADGIVTIVPAIAGGTGGVR